MGLQNNERGNFISIFNGKITQRVPEGTAGSVTRTNKIGKIVTERYFDSFTGKLIGINPMDGTYGKQWYFSFKDKGEVYILTMGYDSSIALAFLAMLPNVDLSKEIKVSASVTQNNKGGENTSIFINQDGKAIKHAYTKENPNGLPPWKAVTINGNTLWDKSEPLAFLENMVNTIIIPKLPKEEAQEVASGQSLDEVFGDEPNPEDQPF